MHAGILGLALPISIIGTNFREIFDMQQAKKFNQRMKVRLSGTHTEELMGEMKHSLETIVSQIDALQTTMRLYERAINEKQELIARQATKDATESILKFGKAQNENDKTKEKYVQKLFKKKKPNKEE